MYSTIVVGTDGSDTADRAVQAAAELARAWGSTLHVVTAFRSGGPGMGQASGAALVDGGVAEVVAREEAARKIGEDALAAHALGVTAEAHAISGDPADAILATAQSVGADLVVVGSKGMRGARRVLGSVPNSVTHGAECAVLVVKTD
jgi:nucleotide-binding universal stress UspA family protein